MVLKAGTERNQTWASLSLLRVLHYIILFCFVAFREELYLMIQIKEAEELAQRQKRHRPEQEFVAQQEQQFVAQQELSYNTQRVHTPELRYFNIFDIPLSAEQLSVSRPCYCAPLKKKFLFHLFSV